MNSAAQETNFGVVVIYFAYLALSILISVKFTKYILAPKLTAYRLFIGWLSFCFIGVAFVAPVYLIVEGFKTVKDFGIGNSLKNIGNSTQAIGYFSMLTFWITSYVISKKENPTIERVLRWFFLLNIVLLVVLFGAFGTGFFKSTPSQQPVASQAPASIQSPQATPAPASANPFDNPDFGKSPQTITPQPATTTRPSETDEQRIAREHFAKIYSAHPDADALMKSSVFNAWVTQSSEGQRVIKQGTAEEVIALFSAYKALR